MNMREKIARAIDPDAFRQHATFYAFCIGKGDSTDEAESAAQWAHGSAVNAAYAKADAALDALMEPTEGMLDAVPASHSVSFQAIWPKICGDVFTAMVRAAKEGK